MKRLVLTAGLLACSHDKPAPPPLVTCHVELGSDTPSNHDALFKRGADLLDPYMDLTGRTSSKSSNKARDLRESIECFDRVLEIRADNWSALWMRGKAYQSAGSHRKARDSFVAAYALEKENPGVGQELVLELMETGEFAKAVEIATEVADAHPADAGLRANLAMALLLAGDVKTAKETVHAASIADPSDTVTSDLEQIIDDVLAGKRPRPTRPEEVTR